MIEILQATHEIGDGGAVPKALQEILADGDAPLALRLEAAVALGHLNYKVTPPFDVRLIVIEIGKLGVEACREECNWMRDRLDKWEARVHESAGRAGGGPSAAAALLGGYQEDDVVTESWSEVVLQHAEKTSRRRLLTRLTAVRQALVGPGAAPAGMARLAGSGPVRAEIARLVEAIDQLGNVVTEDERSFDGLAQLIYENAVKLETAVRKMEGK
jgi:hypothetical protein